MKRLLIDNNNLVLYVFENDDDPVEITPDVRVGYVVEGTEVYPHCMIYNPHTETVSVADEDLFESARENKWAQVRKQRNELLAETDWTRLDDVTITAEEKTAWEEYRQALRDVTNGVENPFAVVWPDKPV